MWYSSVRSNRSLRSPALSTSHTGGSPSHPRISQADAPPLPASASATFASLALRSGLRAVRCAHSRHSRSCEHNRSSFRPLRSAMWSSTPFAALTLAVHTTQAGNAPWKHKHAAWARRKISTGIAGLCTALRGSAWAASSGGVPPGLRPSPGTPGYTLTPRTRSLQSLCSPLAPPSGYTRSGSAPCAPGTRLRTARLRSLRSGGPGGSVPQYRCAGPVPQSRLPPGATPAPPRATAFVVGAGRRRTSGAVRLARVAPPVLSACRSIPRCAALAIPDHHPLRPPWLHARAHADCSLRSQPAPRQPIPCGLFAALTTRPIPLTLVIPVPRTDVLLPLRSSRLVPSLEHLCGPASVPSAYRRIRHPVSAPPYTQAGLRELSASRPVRPVSNDQLRSRTLRSRTLSKSGLWPHPPTPAGRVRLGAAFVNGPLRSPLTGDAPPLQTPARSARGRASLCFLHFLHFLQTAGPPSGYTLRGRSPRGRGSRAPTSPTTALKQIVAPRRHATLGYASLGSATLRITRAGPALRLAAPVLQTSAHAPPVAGLRYTSSVSFVSSVGAGPASAYKHRARSARGRAAL